jgi:ribosomal protein S18 acetylase RimI-like enzyme
MDLESRSVLDCGLSETAELLNRGFADYVVPIALGLTTLLHMVAHDGIDLNCSRIVLRGGEPVGAALIARRGWTSRLAAMAIVPDARGIGVGNWLMEQLIEEGKARGERRMVLEVIEENAAGVRLYRRCGFRVVRRLVSYSMPPTPEAGPHTGTDLEEVDLRDLARMVMAHGWADLPWQVSGESLALMGPPNRAFRLGDAYIALSNPEAPQVGIRAVVTGPEARRQGHATRLLRTVMASFPGKRWGVPALCPEEMGGLFEKVGFEQETLAQFQMALEWQ